MTVDLGWRWYCRHTDAYVPLADANCEHCAMRIAVERSRMAALEADVVAEHDKAKAAHDAREYERIEKPKPKADLQRYEPWPGLTADQDLELRGFFDGALKVAAGCRSSLGPMLDRIKYGLPRDEGGSKRSHYQDEDRGMVCFSQALVSNDAEDRLIDAATMVRRHRLIRDALLSLTPAQVRTLRIVFSPIPDQLVVGLMVAFGNRETAAVSLQSVTLEAPGQSKSEKLRALVARTKGVGGKGPSSTAKDELEELRGAAASAIRDAVMAYVLALRAAHQKASSERAARIFRLREGAHNV